MRTAALFIAFTIAGVFLALMIGGCTSHPVKRGTETRIVTLERNDNATAECIRLGAKAPPKWEPAACAQVGQVCRIVMYPDASNEILGHEVRHCFDGAWHQ